MNRNCCQVSTLHRVIGWYITTGHHDQWLPCRKWQTSTSDTGTYQWFIGHFFFCSISCQSSKIFRKWSPQMQSSMYIIACQPLVSENIILKNAKFQMSADWNILDTTSGLAQHECFNKMNFISGQRNISNISGVNKNVTQTVNKTYCMLCNYVKTGHVQPISKMCISERNQKALPQHSNRYPQYA